MELAPVLVLCLVFGTSIAYDYKTYYYTTKVDHFGYANNDTYKMRYLIADQYWDRKGGPIFFYTGNEGDIEMFTNNTGLMWDWAPEFNALLIFAEHRYYGKSMPYGDQSYKDPKYLGYLTVEQALADFADLLQHLKTTIPGAGTSPVVSFGGSYGGMLAAWFRMKYPHITIAALAASAPVLQFQDITPCGVYNQIVTKSFTSESASCSGSIRQTWSILHKKASTANGLDYLRQTFRTCQLLTPQNYTALKDWLYDTFGNLAMVNYPYPTDFLKEVPGHPVREACRFLSKDFDTDDSLLDAVYHAVNVFHNYSGNVECNDLGLAGGDNLGDEGWDVQTCTEMVMPMCADGVNDMFEPYSWDFEGFRKQCEKKWRLTPELYKAQLMFGGRNMAAASNIIFSNGEIDPWSGGGVLTTTSDSLVAIVIPEAAHHLDLRSANPMDPPSVVQARTLEKSYIIYWLRQAGYRYIAQY